ncbi:MAG: stalk domain-containing protein [Dehalobacterium sp.]
MSSQKKAILIVFCLVMFFSCLSGAYAAQDIKVLINEQQQNFSPDPLIENGSTLVPMRSFFEALGAEIQWYGSSKTVVGKRGNVSVKLTINQKIAQVNDKDVTLSQPGKIINGSTFIPLRFVGEALGDKVAWDAKASTITITSSNVTQSPTLTVHFIDVGQADSIYIQAPNRYDILIDAGNNDDGPAVVTYLNNQGVDDIELLIATHAHEDHIGGLDDVLNAFVVEQIIDSGEVSTTKTYTNYWAAVEAEEAKYQEDSDLTFDLGNNIRFYVIETGDGYSNTNDNSVLTKLDYNNVEFLFTGDMEADVEGSILNKDIQADILKVGHHGSRSSTSETFLNIVNPSSAVISVGEGNTYGHPHEETLNTLKNHGIDTYMTKWGDIICTTDGDKYTFNTEPMLMDFGGEPGTGIAVPATPVPSTGQYVGSIKSDKFHYPSCRNVETILPENRIWFGNKEEAISKGYAPCGACEP